MRLKSSTRLTIVLLLFAIFNFSSYCSAQRLPDEEFSFIKGSTENGFIFGSVTFPNEVMKYDAYFIEVAYVSLEKKLRRRNSNKIIINPTMFNKKHIGELDGGRTYLFAVEKPVGNYSICWLRLSTLKLMQYSSNDTNITGFSIPFTVNKGEIMYIGNININEYDLGCGQVINIKDEFERDKNAINNFPMNVNFNEAIKSEIKIITY